MRSSVTCSVLVPITINQRPAKCQQVGVPGSDSCIFTDRVSLQFEQSGSGDITPVVPVNAETNQVAPEHSALTPRPGEEAASLDTALRVGRVGPWSLDLLSGRVTWSEEICDLFGISMAEFAGTVEQWTSFILTEDLPAYLAALDRVSQTEPLAGVEYRIRRADDAVRWFYERSQTEFDSEGIPVRRLGIVMDITERHESRAQLAQSAAVLAQIAGRAARLGGWMITLPERELTWSDENCAIHEVPPGYKPTLEEGIGYFPAEYQEEVMGHVEQCALEGTPYDFEFPKYTAKGNLIWVRSIGEAVRDTDGKITRLQGAFQDITVRKQAEAERERLIKELQVALEEVKTLREILPICMYCKQVRDDEGAWGDLEAYVRKHKGTDFSHGMCDPCSEKFYPDVYARLQRQRAEKSQNGSLTVDEGLLEG